MCLYLLLYLLSTYWINFEYLLDFKIHRCGFIIPARSTGTDRVPLETICPVRTYGNSRYSCQYQTGFHSTDDKEGIYISLTPSNSTDD